MTKKRLISKQNKNNFKIIKFNMLEKEIGRSKNLYTHTCISIPYDLSRIK